jgi:hypothetical protein
MYSSTLPAWFEVAHGVSCIRGRDFCPFLPVQAELNPYNLMLGIEYHVVYAEDYGRRCVDEAGMQQGLMGIGSQFCSPMERAPCLKVAKRAAIDKAK